MSFEYLENYKQLEKLIGKMNIPSRRKKVGNNDDVRWLSRNLTTFNSQHKNYTKAIELIHQII